MRLFLKFTGKFTDTAVYCEPTGEVQVPRENDEKKNYRGRGNGNKKRTGPNPDFNGNSRYFLV